MSHYTVMVIGAAEDELGEALAPYDENLECNPEFKAATDEDISYMADHYRIEMPKNATALQVFNLIYPHSKDWWGQEAHFVGGEIGYYSTYNPDSKWDWWCVGGRWDGYLRLKDGSEVNSALKGDIDFAGQRAIERIKADNAYTLWENFVSENGEPPKWNPPSGADAKKYRKEYHNDPVIKRMHEVFPTKDWGFMFNPIDEFSGVLRDEYVHNAEVGTMLCWATLDANSYEWIAPGNMGWWGMSDESRNERAAYNKRVYDLIESLDDQVIITIVDCHI